MFKVNPYAVIVNAREIKAKWEAASQLQAFLLELGYDVHDAQVPRAHGCAGAAE